MPTSQSNVEAAERAEPAAPSSYPSIPTLGCFTDAIILREGAGAVGSTYLRDSASVPASSSTSPPSLATPTSLSGLPPYTVHRPARKAPRYVIQAGPLPLPLPLSRSTRTARPSKKRRPPAKTTRTPPKVHAGAWPVVSALAVGAAVAALLGVLSASASGVFAILACVLAGAITMRRALEGR
jgi:hypothetical protein